MDKLKDWNMDQDWVVNTHMNALQKQEGELIDLELQFRSMDQGCKTTFEHIDKDLEALDGCVDRRRRKCKQTTMSLQIVE